MPQDLSAALITDGPPDDDPGLIALAGRQPSARARRAEEVAQIVLGDPSTDTTLRALVRRATDATEAETGQISIVSTRQIALVVEKGVRRRPGTIAADNGAVSPFYDTLCAVSVRADAAVVIPDTTLDERVASLPAVTRGIVGSYLGCPVHGPTGDVLGVLCVYNSHTHSWTNSDVSALAALADEVARELELIASTHGATT